MSKLQKTVDEFYTVFAETKCVVGEGPLWVSEENSFYWVDITEGLVYRKVDDVSAKVECFDLQLGKIGGIVQTRSGDFLLFAQYGIVYRWKPYAEPKKFAELPEARALRFNDIAVAPNGDVFCGVAPDANGFGALWKFDCASKFTPVDLSLVGMPNGMGFSPDEKIFYLTVSDERAIYKFDYRDGVVENKTVFARLAESVEGVPDGMAVDAQGNVWSANWNGYSLSKYAPSGEVIVTFHFPIKKITSVAFGGEDMSKLLITTANYPWVEADYQKFSSGCVFEFLTAVRGLARFKANF